MSDRLRRFTERFTRLVFFRTGGCSREWHLLEEHLQREAEAERPQFSADLHRRLCHAVRHAASRATREPVPWEIATVGLQVARRKPFPLHRAVLSRRMRIAWVGLAVAGVLFTGWVVRLGSWGTFTDAPETYVARQDGLAGRADLVGRTDFMGRADNPTASLATLATLPEQASGRVEQWLVASVSSGQWASLKHDARLVGQWLVEDLPWTVPARDAELESSPSSS